MRFSRAIFASIALAAGLLGVGGACAQSAPPKPAADEPRFEIRRFVFDGAKLVPREQLESETASFVGKGRTFGDVQKALETVEKVYSRLGYSAVQIVLPEQELEKGEIRFQVIEAKLGRVIVEGNKFFDEANIRTSLPALQSGEAPNINAIARNLRIANESPSKQTTVLLRSGQEEATVDAVARVVDEDPIKGSVTVDTSGSQKTGRLRTGLGFQNSNMWGLDHVLTFQFISAFYRDVDKQYDKNDLSIWPSKDAQIFGASYRVPLYRSGDTLDLTWAWSNVSVGQVAGFAITGVGSVAGARYTKNLDRIDDYEHRLSFAYDFRGYNNKGIRPAGSTVQVIPDLNVHPITVQYSGSIRRQDSESSFSIGLSKNIPGGKDGRGTEFCQTRQVTIAGSGHFECARADFQVVRWAFNHNLSIGDEWQARFGMNGQATRDMLVPGEQFGVGGVDSVRGFLEREVINDVGHRGTMELYTPDFGKWTTLAGARLRAVFFYDWGRVKRNRPSAAELHGQAIASIGAGLRFSLNNNFVFRTDYGIVRDQGGSQGRNDGRLTFSGSYIY